jgi:hypothetical protein
VIGVNKVHMVAISSLQQLRVLGDLEGVPSNVRNYETPGRVESSDNSRYHTKAAYCSIECTVSFCSMSSFQSSTRNPSISLTRAILLTGIE